MNIKDNLKSARLQNNLTLEELANKIGTSKQTIQRYESGIIGNIPRNKITKLAKALNVNELWLMGYDVKMDADSRLFIDNDTTRIFELTEENFIKNPDIAKDIFDSVGEMIIDLSKMFPDQQNSVYPLSDIFNNNDISLSSKLVILKSMIDVVKYDSASNTITFCYNFSSDESEENELMNDYNNLNDVGKKEAKKRLHELTYIDEYRKKKEENKQKGDVE